MMVQLSVYCLSPSNINTFCAFGDCCEERLAQQIFICRMNKWWISEFLNLKNLKWKEFSKPHSLTCFLCPCEQSLLWTWTIPGKGAHHFSVKVTRFSCFNCSTESVYPRKTIVVLVIMGVEPYSSLKELVLFIKSKAFFKQMFIKSLHGLGALLTVILIKSAVR